MSDRAQQSDGGKSPAKADRPRRARRHHRRRLTPLPLGARLLVLFVGGLLILIGIAGLLLPGIQGILTIVLGAAVLSLASDWVYKLQRRILGRWPGISQRMERFRQRTHDLLSRGSRHRNDAGSDVSDGSGAEAARRAGNARPTLRLAAEDYRSNSGTNSRLPGPV